MYESLDARSRFRPRKGRPEHTSIRGMWLEYSSLEAIGSSDTRIPFSFETFREADDQQSLPNLDPRCLFSLISTMMLADIVFASWGSDRETVEGRSSYKGMVPVSVTVIAILPDCSRSDVHYERRATHVSKSSHAAGCTPTSRLCYSPAHPLTEYNAAPMY
jgi:hypothetical protein